MEATFLSWQAPHGRPVGFTCGSEWQRRERWREAGHTVYHERQWLNEVEGARPMRGDFRLKTQAVEAGRRRAQRDNVEHLIHTRDETISSRNSYGLDPRRSKG